MLKLVEFVELGLPLMQPEQKKKTRVLLVDDDDKILRFLALKLKLFGYELITAANGSEGLSQLKLENPDVIVLDILMPIMDGFEMLQQLRTFSKLPVIVLSAKGDNAERAMELGANDFLAKPFKPDELVDRIEAHVDHGGKPFMVDSQ
jgi:two-component system KDP operon response regulator KdpE